MMLNYQQISMQLYPYVERYQQEHPDESFFPEAISNISIYDETGLFVSILLGLVGGSEIGKEYDRFYELCDKYKLKKLSAIDEADANELWDEFHKLYHH